MAPHPFRFVVETPLGPIRVDVCESRTATLADAGQVGPTPTFAMSLGDRPFSFRARVALVGSGWSIREMSVYPRSRQAPVRQADVVAAMLPALSAGLDANMRRFVEREVVQIFRERADARAEIDRVQAEIDRRLAKIAELERRGAEVEARLSAREAALRAELAALDALPTS